MVEGREKSLRLELQPGLARRIRKRTYATVVLKSATVKSDGIDPRLEGLLRNPLPNNDRSRGIAALAT